MGGQLGAHKGIWEVGHTQLLERVCKGKLMEKSLEDCSEDAAAFDCGSGIDVGEQASQAGRRAKHRTEGSKDKRNFLTFSAFNSHQEIAKMNKPVFPYTSACTHISTHLTTMTFRE